MPFHVSQVKPGNDTDKNAIGDFYCPHEFHVGLHDGGKQPGLEGVKHEHKRFENQGMSRVARSGYGFKERDPETEAECCQSDHVKGRNGSAYQVAAVGIDG